MILPIGRLDCRITIQSFTQEQSADYGEPTETWADWATVWANINSGARRELEEAPQVTAEIDTQFQIRWISGLNLTMHILYEGRVYYIHRIQEAGRRERWNIYAKARQQWSDFRKACISGVENHFPINCASSVKLVATLGTPPSRWPWRRSSWYCLWTPDAYVCFVQEQFCNIEDLSLVKFEMCYSFVKRRQHSQIVILNSSGFMQ